MKKLMIVAALAATTVATAEADDCTPTTQPAMVYQVKMNVKTTKGVSKTLDKSDCGPTGGVIREKDSTKFEGWIYDCSYACNLVESGTSVMWDSKRKAPFTSSAFTTTFLNVFGKNQKSAEWAWTFEGTVDYAPNSDNSVEQTYNLTGAGYGKFDTKKRFYKSFSGNFAGTASASLDLKSANCDPSQIWKCDNLNDLADSDTIAFGTWTVKYSKSASDKYARNGISALKLPSYAVVAE